MQVSYFQQKVLDEMYNAAADNNSYNAHRNYLLILECDKEVDLNYLEKSTTLVLGRHDILNARIRSNDGKKALYHEKAAIVFRTIDLRKSNKSRSRNELLNSIYGLDFRKIPERANLFQIYEILLKECTFLVFVFHPLIVDDYSLKIITKEIRFNYDLLKKGNTQQVYSTFSFGQFVNWQKDLSQDYLHSLMFYWRERLKNFSNYGFPADNVAAAGSLSKMDLFQFTIPQKLKFQFDDFCSSVNKAPEIVLLSLLKIIIFRYSFRESISILSCFSNRETRQLSEIIGPLSNRFIIKDTLDDKDTFISVIDKLKRSVDEAYMHKDLPFEMLQKYHDNGSGLTCNVGFAFQNGESISDPDDNHIRQVAGCPNFNHCHLNFSFFEDADSLTCMLTYNRDLYTNDFIDKIKIFFLRLLKELIRKPLETILKIPLYDVRTKKLLSGTLLVKSGYPHDKTLVSIFNEQVAGHPETIAIVSDDLQLSYREIDERSNRLAHYMTENYGIEPEQLVGLILERGVSQVIAILAILKSGAAYVPIDPSYPEERIKFIVEDASLKLLLRDSAVELDLPVSAAVLNIEEKEEEISQYSSLPLLAEIKANHLAYVIYTSGTTGYPNGVLVEHRNVVQLLFPENPIFDFNSSDVWVLFHSYCFDFSVWEIFGCLLKGGRLVIIPLLTAQDGAAFLSVLHREGVTVLNQTPGAFKNLMTAIKEQPELLLDVRYVIIGREALQPSLLSYWKDHYPHSRAINMYGITETTVHSTYREITEQDIQSGQSIIGRSLPASSIYVLDKYRQLVPLGGVGELYVGGSGVTRGYLNRPKLNEERFIADPFIQDGRMYKSGDWVHLQSDGNLRYIGRIDRQVKIRGYRIELGEIERVLEEYSGVESSAIIAREDREGNNYLSAYVIAGDTVTLEELRNHLLSRLPGYMVPGYFSFVEKWPLTKNGKIDYKLLPDLDQYEEQKGVYQGPRDEYEVRVISVWEEILGRNRIGIRDDFFETGGHSLAAIQLVSHLHKATGVKLELRHIFKYPTAEEQSALIRSSTQKKTYKAIPKAAAKEYYGVSSAQKRLFILYELDKDSLAYNMPSVFRLEGVFDYSRIHHVFCKLIDRHESLRTGFFTIEGHPVQKIYPEVEFTIEDYSGMKLSEAMEKFTRPFKLDSAPLLRAGFIKEAEDSHCLLLDMHHIISDGISTEILLRDFLSLYNGEELASLPLQYKDYAEWQVGNTEYRQLLEKQKKYWINEFSEPAEIINLPLDFIRPAIKNYQGSDYEFCISKEDTNALKKLAREERVTMFMLLLGIYNVLLSRLSNQEDIVIGSPSAGRTHSDVEGLIGMFVNTLALRNIVKGEKSFKELLQQIKENTLAAFANQDYQYEELLEQLTLSRDTGRNPLFDVMLVVAETEKPIPSIEGLKASLIPHEQKTSKFDLTLYCRESEEQFRLTLVYSTQLFKPATISKFGLYLQKTITCILQDPDQPIARIDILPAAEKQLLLNIFNNTNKKILSDKPLIKQFEEQVEISPDKIALVFNDTSLTYNELNVKANQLARYLYEEYAIQTEELIGIKLERSEWMVIAILAALKSGGAYLPIDPTFPAGRVDHIVRDSQCKTVIDEAELKKFREMQEYPIDNLPVNYHTENLVYVIYTSGSTGGPKGVMVENKGVMNRIEWMWKNYGFTADDIILQKTNFTFDVSVWEIFMPLCWGAKMILCNKDDVVSPERMLALIKKHRITCMHFVPSMLYVFMDSLFAVKNINHDLRSLKKVFCSGEALTVEVVKNWYRKTDIPLYNLYGPTEASVDVTSYTISDGDQKIYIGKPIWNTKIYILGNNGSLLPAGVPGEICIAGIGLARGYVNRPDLTSEKFVADPFVDGALMYLTGDIGAWSTDGNIKFLGRRDDQLKIRGYRIEISEIETQLRTYESIKNFVIISRDNKHGVKELIAFIVPFHEFDPAAIRRHLSMKLPEYMIPSKIIRLDDIPLTINGKINKKILADLEEIDVQEVSVYQGPRDEYEMHVILVWEEILGRKRIGMRDNFFETGGHSLAAIQLVSHLHKATGVKLELRDIFNSPTAEEQSALIKSSTQRKTYKAIQKAEQKEYYAVSSAQKRLFILYELDKDSLAYNMPTAFRLEGVFDYSRIHHVFCKLIERHESLRTGFFTIEGHPVQKIYPEVEFTIEEYSGMKVSEAMEKFTRPFKLDSAPLMRAGFIKEAEQSHCLLLDMHHIISDGVSVEILLRDFLSIYNGEEHGALQLQYKDYAEWQVNNTEYRQLLEKQKQYWVNEFSEPAEILNLPLDFSRPAIKNYQGSDYEFCISKEDTNALKKLAREERVTLFMLLLGLYNVLLSRLSNQEDIVIGSPSAGRTHSDVEGLIGMFVNTLALRNIVKGEKSFKEFLQQIKENTLAAFENQDYQYEELLEQLTLSRDTGRNPLFDVMLVVAGEEKPIPSIEGLKTSLIPHEEKTSKFDLMLYCREREDQFWLTLEYSTQLFKPATISKFGLYLQKTITCILQDPDQPIARIDILPAAEKQLLLNVSNNPPSTYPHDKTLVSIFNEQVASHPETIAIVSDDLQLSYREIDERSNRLAHYMTENYGIEPEQLVGLILERGVLQVIAILAILKSGAAYVPIDPSYPEERIKFIVEDASLKLLLSDSAVELDLPVSAAVLNIEEKEEEISQYSSLPLLAEIKANHLAYVIYTSGTTGYPKGVLVEHRNVVQLLFPENPIFDFNNSDVWVLFHSYCFDFSVWEIFGCLLNGGRLVIIPLLTAQDGSAFLSVLHREGVTVLNQTPGAFKNLMAAVKEQAGLLLDVRYVIFGGESLQPSLLSYWKDHYPHSRIINMYGITETAVLNTFKEITEQDIQSGQSIIGRSLPASSIYVLDKYRQLVPLGGVGELYVGGSGVTRGYLNRPKLNEERFIADPFIQDGRMYKSGDWVHLQSDGNLRYIGRIDRQVKIRGYRIELGEIERVLEEYSGVESSAIIAREDREGNNYLSAYVIAGDTVTLEELRNHLLSRLPGYMVPGYFSFVEKWPLTKNGKIDYKLLPDLDQYEEQKGVYQGPRDEYEVRVISVWEEILGRNRIGIRDNFFETGGHSLAAIQLVSHLHKATGIKLELRDIFSYPTAEEQSALIKSSTQKKTYKAIPKAAAKEYYAVSSAQKRLFILYELDKDSLAYNMPSAFRLEGVFDHWRIHNVFCKLIDRHESLRTGFLTIEGQPVQKIYAEVEFIIEDYSGMKLSEAMEKFTRPFKLDSAPLLRAGFIKEAEDSHCLLLDMHHIISDGVSIEILLRDFLSLYNGEELASLPLQYKDYAEWQVGNTEYRQLLEEQKKYWINEFSTMPPILNLPFDFTRSRIKQSKGDCQKIILPADLSQKLYDLSRRENLTLFTLTFAIYNILIFKLTNQSTFVVGTPVTLRTNPDLENIAGIFINMLPVKINIDANTSFIEYVKELANKIIESIDNKEYPFEDLVEEILTQRDTSRNPIFDLTFAFDQQNAPTIENPDFLPIATDIKTSKYDLSCHGQVSGQQIEFTFEYSCQLFRKSTIKDFVNYFIEIISQITADDSCEIRNLALLSGEAQKKLFDNVYTPFEESQSTLHLLFEKQAEKYPDNIAAVFEDQKITYKELNEKSNQLAEYLIDLGVVPGNVVAIHASRSIEMILGIIAILKAGCAYLPLDAEYPSSRIKQILTDAGISTVLITNDLKSRQPDFCRVVEISGSAFSAYAKNNLHQNYDPAQLAYVIYTSGTTGEPCGVMVEHKSIINTLIWRQRYYNFKQGDTVLQLPSFAFDSSVEEIFGTLIAGARLVLIHQAKRLQLAHLKQLITGHRVNYILIVPQLYKEFLLDHSLCNYDSLKAITLAGDHFSSDLIKLHFESLPYVELFNEYGPTENSVCTTIYKFSPFDDTVLIGKAIDNVSCYILDPQLNCCPPGVAGELYAGGLGLSRGYLNATKKKKDPFVISHFNAGCLLYPTGDMAIAMKDGNLKFLGRIDQQIKIRGNRIDILEIENFLKTMSGIEEAMVIIQSDDNSDQSLIAYIKVSGEMDILEIRERMRLHFPDYMIPSSFFEIEKIPLNANGKIERSAKNIPAKRLEISSTAKEPVTELESLLCDLWKKILNRDQVGIYDNFFDLGGNSLKAIQLTSMLNTILEYEFKVIWLFEYPSIYELAGHLELKTETHKTADEPVDSLLETFEDSINNLFNQPK